KPRRFEQADKDAICEYSSNLASFSRNTTYSSGAKFAFNEAVDWDYTAAIDARCGVDTIVVLATWRPGALGRDRHSCGLLVASVAEEEVCLLFYCSFTTCTCVHPSAEKQSCI
ncbi:MAG: hypothetical protein SGPRY_007964, partial [Prymnesium sp.]